MSLPILADIGLTYAYAGRYEESAAAYRKALELDPSYPVAHANMAEMYWRMGRFDDALKEYETAIGLAGRTPTYVRGLGLIDASTKRRVEAQKRLDELNQMAERKYVPPALRAMLYAAVGQKDQAFAFSRKHIQNTPHN